MTSRSAHLPPGGHVRVGDRERSEASDRLAAHAAAGRLGVEELEQRLERVQAAVHVRDLAAVEADLPHPARRAPGRRPPLLAAAFACLIAGGALTIAFGHPFPPLLIGAFLMWRFGGWAPGPVGAWR
jgi:hypothetical protein